MTIRYVRGVLTEDRDLDAAVWMGLVHARVPVGQCEECGSAAYGFRLEKYRGLWHAEAQCQGEPVSHTASMAARLAGSRRAAPVAGRTTTRQPRGGRVAA